MNICKLENLDLERWAAFEAGFSYPLGGRLFRYESNPSVFFGAGGDPFGWFAVDSNGDILASVAGFVLGGKTAWFGMVRAVRTVAGRLAFARVAVTAMRELKGMGVTVGLGGVMVDSVPPTKYSGRISLPLFSPRAEMALVGFAAKNGPPSVGDATMAPIEISVDGACGIVADTRFGKRLFWLDTGVEFSPLFLTHLRFDGEAALWALAEKANSMKRSQQLFLSLPSEVAYRLAADFPVSVNRWTLFGTAPYLGELIEPTFL